MVLSTNGITKWDESQTS